MLCVLGDVTDGLFGSLLFEGMGRAPWKQTEAGGVLT